MNLFGCTKYQVDTARKWRSSNDSLLLPQHQVHKRLTLDTNKCEHFLEFIFNSGLLQDVAYGVSRIKFDSGIVQKVANAVLTTKYSHTIALYEMNCASIGYKPLSQRSLWRILKAVKLSTRKCLGNSTTQIKRVFLNLTFIHATCKKGKTMKLDKSPFLFF